MYFQKKTPCKVVLLEKKKEIEIESRNKQIKNSKTNVKNGKAQISSSNPS